MTDELSTLAIAVDSPLSLPEGALGHLEEFGLRCFFQHGLDVTVSADLSSTPKAGEHIVVIGRVFLVDGEWVSADGASEGEVVFGHKASGDPKLLNVDWNNKAAVTAATIVLSAPR